MRAVDRTWRCTRCGDHGPEGHPAEGYVCPARRDPGEEIRHALVYVERTTDARREP